MLYGSEKQPALYFMNQSQETMQSRKVLPLSKRARTIDDEFHVHDGMPPAHRRRLLQQKPNLEQLNAVQKAPIRVLLTPCHICHRKPTKKSDLDSFAECQGCAERTCFVCIRECQGWIADEDPSILSEQEVLSRSCHMNDADDSPHDQDDSHQRQQSNSELRRDQLGSRLEGVRRGWDAGGHRTVVCSRCCIERGEEGEIVCLGCLSGMEAS